MSAWALTYIIRLEGNFTMMQPIDIKSHSFGTGLFGYKKSDVDQYVDTVYRAYDELFTENKNLRDEKDRLNKLIEENRVRIFELENKIGEGPASDDAKDDAKDKKETKADTANPFTETASKDDPFADLVMEDKAEDKKEDAKEESKLKMGAKDSATSQFFQNNNDDVFGDGDDVFVGEIEDNRKSNKAMIGDGEEEGADDFEFL